MWTGQSDMETDLPDLYANMGSFGFSFKLIILFFRKSIQILFTDRALLTIRRMDQILAGEGGDHRCLVDPQLTHLAPDQLLPFRYEIRCEGK